MTEVAILIMNHFKYRADSKLQYVTANDLLYILHKRDPSFTLVEVEEALKKLQEKGKLVQGTQRPVTGLWFVPLV